MPQTTHTYTEFRIVIKNTIFLANSELKILYTKAHESVAFVLQCSMHSIGAMVSMNVVGLVRKCMNVWTRGSPKALPMSHALYYIHLT